VIDYRVGDVRTVLGTVGSETVSLVATSPPFLALRNYTDGDEREIGRELDPSTFVDTLEHETQGPPPRPRPAPAWVLLLRPLVYALVLAGRVPVLERIYWNPLKRREWARKDANAVEQGATGLIRP